MIYAFAIADTLVINCEDYATAWRIEEEHGQLRSAIVQNKGSIQTILVEKFGKTLYYW
jgi:hypothetical protein